MSRAHSKGNSKREQAGAWNEEKENKNKNDKILGSSIPEANKTDGDTARGESRALTQREK